MLRELLMAGCVMSFTLVSAWATDTSQVLTLRLKGEARLVAHTETSGRFDENVSGRISLENGDEQRILEERTGYRVVSLDSAKFGDHRMIVVGWASGGQGRYLRPAVYVTDDRSGWTPVWRPFQDEPLLDGEVRIRQEEGRSVLTISEDLDPHDSGPPRLRRLRTGRWQSGQFRLSKSEYGPAETMGQKASLAREYFLDGKIEASLDLYNQVLSSGTFGQDRRLAAELHRAAALCLESLGRTATERTALKALIRNYPETDPARHAANRLLRIRASDLDGRKP